jgi:hypothetical protein
MDSVVSFYNTLFSIEIAVFGIIAAAIFVFLQIVYSQFSYRAIYAIFKNRILVLYLIISTVTLLFTAAGSLILSFPGLSSISGASKVAPDIFRDWVVASSLLASFLLSLILFVVFTVLNISYIRPSRVALLISKGITNDQIRDFLLRKYGVPAPDDWVFLSRQYGAELLFIRATGPESDQKHELGEEERAQMERKKQQLAKTILENKKRHEMMKKAVEHAENPMEPLDALMLKAINSVDLATIEEIQSLLLRISTNFISHYKDDADKKEWFPESGIIQKYLEYLRELFGMHLNMCDRQKLDPVKVRCLETTEKTARQVILANAGAIEKILTFWKEIADDAIGESRIIFNTVIQLYQGLADYAFESGIEDNRDWLDEIFRDLGWLGERLISQQGIEEKPIMSDHDYFNEYDRLYEALSSFGYDYSYKYPTAYPLIYFDAVRVVFLQLVPAFKKCQNPRLKGNIFSLMYVYASFAEAAIPNGNSIGAALAASHLKRSYNDLLSQGPEESAKEAIKLLVRIGGIAARHKDKLEKVDFLGNQTIDEFIIDIVVSSPFQEDVIYEVREAYIGSDLDWNFVTKMGKLLGTNFGFMFDCSTGELYAEDDPRRK